MSDQDWVAEFHTAFDAWDKRYIITSNDIDGFLSAAAIAQYCRNKGHNTSLIGVYTGRHVVLFDGHSKVDARDAIWLDHDISHEGVICMGQHLVRLHPDDQIQRRHRPTFNPNLWMPGLACFKQGGGTYCFKGFNKPGIDKYPFATIHYIMAALGIPEPDRGTLAYSLIAHADSAWACGYKYGPNCQIWFDEMFDGTGEIVREITLKTYCGPQNLATHRELVEKLRELKIKADSSENKKSDLLPDDWDGINGNQSLVFNIRWHNGSSDKREKWMGLFRNLWEFIISELGWRIETPQRITDVISGTYNRVYPDRIPSLDELLDREKVFSHAITGSGAMKYTTDLDLT